MKNAFASLSEKVFGNPRKMILRPKCFEKHSNNFCVLKSGIHKIQSCHILKNRGRRLFMTFFFTIHNTQNCKDKKFQKIAFMMSFCEFFLVLLSFMLWLEILFLWKFSVHFSFSELKSFWSHFLRIGLNVVNQQHVGLKIFC